MLAIVIIIAAWTVWGAYQAVAEDLKVKRTHLDDRMIDDFFRGRLNKNKRLRKNISKHLSVCETCRDRLHEIRMADNAKMRAKRAEEL